MIGGPMIETTMMMEMTISPKTASLFLSSRFHASFQSEVPLTASAAPRSAVRTSPSPTASSAVGRVMSPPRVRTGGGGGVPSVLSAGSRRPACPCSMDDSSFFMASIPDAGVDEPVGDVNQKVEDQDQDRDEGDDADDQRLVAREVGVDEVVPEAGQREDALDHDRP